MSVNPPRMVPVCVMTRSDFTVCASFAGWGSHSRKELVYIIVAVAAERDPTIVLCAREGAHTQTHMHTHTFSLSLSLAISIPSSLTHIALSAMFISLSLSRFLFFSVSFFPTISITPIFILFLFLSPSFSHSLVFKCFCTMSHKNITPNRKA